MAGYVAIVHGDGAAFNIEAEKHHNIPAMSDLHQPGHTALTRSVGLLRAQTREYADIAILLVP